MTYALIPDTLLAKAEETYRLELALGKDHAEALRGAISSVLREQALQILADVAHEAVRMAERIDSEEDDDMACDGPASLLWLSKAIQDTLPKD